MSNIKSKDIEAYELFSYYAKKNIDMSTDEIHVIYGNFLEASGGLIISFYSDTGSILLGEDSLRDYNDDGRIRRYIEKCLSEEPFSNYFN